MIQARSAFGIKCLLPSLWNPPKLQELPHPSLTSLVAPQQIPLEKVTPNMPSSCMKPKHSTPASTAMCSMFPFNLLCHTSSFNLALTNTTAAAHGPKCVVFLYDAQVLNTDIHRPVLPVSIQSVMPHILLQLGIELNNSSCPSICCVMNTAAALCTGNYHFFAALAKQYPQCVAKIFLPGDFSPIILSGIVQDNAYTNTTNLSVAFQFHLPYLTKDGRATSFVVATGPQVSINTVLGLPLIKATGMSCCSCQSEEAGLPRPQCRQMDVYSHALWANKQNSNFINFIHDINSQWKVLAQQSGLLIDNETNTKIIVDDVEALLSIKCQLCICQSYQLSLRLRKSHIFPKRFEFGWIDVCSNGNCPAIIKHHLLVHWPQLEIICNIAKIVGFAQFYRKCIPRFEL
jgi:hypothetical protein